MNQRFSVRNRLMLAVASAVLGQSCMVVAASGAAASTPNAMPQGSAAMRVERDPQTGQLRPSTEPLSKAEQALVSADPSKVTRETKSNGTRVYHLNGQGRETLVAHRRADGTLEMQCTDRAEGAFTSQELSNER